MDFFFLHLEVEEIKPLDNRKRDSESGFTLEN